jgi:hemerythrin
VRRRSKAKSSSYIDGNPLVGLAELDEQHRNLACLVNRLSEALQHNETPKFIAKIFDELLVATTYHFETESCVVTQTSFDRYWSMFGHSGHGS